MGSLLLKPTFNMETKKLKNKEMLKTVMWG